MIANTHSPAKYAVLKKIHDTDKIAKLDKIVDGNAPFELKPPAGCPSGHGKPYRRGVLLTHGLTDSPYSMRALGSFFQKNCFRVMAILLPGHGTQPGDLLDVVWQEWAKAEAYGTDQLAAEVDEVYLAGFSTGGALSVYQSQDDPRVRGLFLFSPALEVDSIAALANVHKYRIFGYAWLDVMPDKDIYKYESFPKNAAAQIYALTQAVKSRLEEHAVSIPVFAAASQDDTTVHASATIEFIAHTLDSVQQAGSLQHGSDESAARFSCGQTGDGEQRLSRTENIELRAHCDRSASGG